MIKYWNRLKYWFLVRRYHIDDIKFEGTEEGVLNVYVHAKGQRILILTNPTNTEGLYHTITDYGIYKAISKGLK